MNNLMKWLSIDAPTGWADAIARAVKTAIIVFVVLELKELFESGGIDPTTDAVDGLLVGAALLAINAIFVVTKPPTPVR